MLYNKISLILCILLFGCAVDAYYATLGVNLSQTYALNPLHSRLAIRRMKELDVNRIKVYTTSSSLLDLIRTEIPDAVVTCIVSNADVITSSTNTSYAAQIVAKLTPYSDIVKYLAVGNEPLGAWQPSTLRAAFLPSFVNLDAALAAASSTIKITVAMNFDVLEGYVGT